MTDIFIEGGRALLGGEFVEASLQIADGTIGARRFGPRPQSTLALDARGLLVLPGHRRSAWRCVRAADDAAPRRRFPDRCGADRQRPAGDRQRHHHGVSRHDLVVGAGPAQRRQCAGSLLEAIEALRPQLAADTRFHLRHETYNLDAEAEICQWLADGRIDLLAFNDHMDSTVARSSTSRRSAARMVERTGLSSEEFDAWSSASPSRAARRARRRSRGWPKRARRRRADAVA